LIQKLLTVSVLFAGLLLGLTSVLISRASPPSDSYPEYIVWMKEQADLSPAYAIEDWEDRGWFVYKTLRQVADNTQRHLLADLANHKLAGKVQQVQPFWVVNALVVRGDEVALRALATQPEVARVFPAPKLRAPDAHFEPAATSPNGVEWNIRRINADDVWAMYSFTNSIVVANIDTGVQYNHPALVRQYRGNLTGTPSGPFDHDYNWWDPTGSSSVPAPLYPGNRNHGTHVMGIQVGDDDAGNQIGVAPMVKWIAAYGCCPDNASLLSAIQWILAPTRRDGTDPEPSKRPHVVNHSWGGPGGSLMFNALLEAQHAAGIVPVFSAGNSGSGCGTLGSPADNPAAFSVGNTTSDDSIAPSSSRGPNPFNGIDPQVVAPGSGIRSSVPGGYSYASGTSMAAPHVAGTVGLLLALEPDLVGQVDQIEEILRATSVPLTTTAQSCGGVPGTRSPNNTYGWGRIDALAAVQMVYRAGELAGIITDATTSLPVAGATVAIARNGHALRQTTATDGRFQFTVGAGSYQVQASGYGYTPTLVSGVTVTQDEATKVNFALVPKPLHTLSGTVTNRMDGLPIAAMVQLLDTPVPAVRTDPVTGWYSLTVAAGEYVVRVTAQGFASREVTVSVRGEITRNVALTPTHDYLVQDNQGTCASVTFDWKDITDGTAYRLSDGGQVRVPFPGGKRFRFYGQDYEAVYITDDGYLRFGSSQYSPFHGVIPHEGPPNNQIMVLGEDFNPASGAQGLVYTKAFSDSFVVEYYQVEHWASGFPETFEVILGFADHSITMQYQTLSWPDFTSVGVENADGTAGILYSLANSADLQPGRAVRFVPIFGRPIVSMHYFPLIVESSAPPHSTRRAPKPLHPFPDASQALP